MVVVVVEMAAKKNEMWWWYSLVMDVTHLEGKGIEDRIEVVRVANICPQGLMVVVTMGSSWRIVVVVVMAVVVVVYSSFRYMC